MSEILLYYRRPDPTTWVYLSSFLTVGLFFVFHRVWSVRNADLILLILLGPGVLMVHEGYRRELVHREARASETRRLTATQPQTDAGQETDAIQLAQSVGSGRSSMVRDPNRTLDQVAPRPLTASPQTLVAKIARVADVAIVTDDGINAGTANDSPPSASPNEVLSDESASQNSLRTDEEVESRDATPMTSNRRSGSSSRVQMIGFVYLFVIEMIIVLRLMFDPMMVRRPRLDPNLSSGGLTFIGVSLFVFMMANVVNSNARIQQSQGPALGPGYALMNMLPTIPTRPDRDLIGGGTVTIGGGDLVVPGDYMPTLASLAKALSIAAHFAIVLGIVLVCNRHFGNLPAGMGCATLYLMLPYTAQMTGRVDHAVPAALLLWAVLFYRRPMVAGIFIGLAAGLVYYPLFLLPLWMSFYWRRGLRPFFVGVVAMLAMLMLLLAVDRTDTSLLDHLQQMFGILNPLRDRSELEGFWRLGPDPIWRLPVIVAFVILSLFFAIWPAQKNLGTLIAGSAAIMVAAQFWHGNGGGLYIAWFLPLLLLTVFRPNLQDRIATKVVRIPRPSTATT